MEAHMRVSAESLERHWLSGTTCHRHTRSVHWRSADGKWILMKHHGHSEYIDRMAGTGRCATHYDLFREGEEFPRTLEDSAWWHHEGRMTKAAEAKMHEIIRWVK